VTARLHRRRYVPAGPQLGDVLLSVTGGTNRFARVRGHALFDYSTSGQVTITYQLILRP
jgi:hypothetical protein